jgi:transglutaminase-like putative cysteine protease
MRMSIRHLTRYRYQPEAASAALRLRLWPPAAAAQRPVSWAVSVNGAVVEPIAADAHGDRIGLWHAHAPTGEIEIVAEGVIETADLAGVLSELPQRARPGLFLRRTALTETSEAIRALGADVGAGVGAAAGEAAYGGAGGTDVLARCHALSAAVHAAVDYRPGVSNATTTAVEALALGAGVCQDQTHVFIAAARVLDIPARYVVGYLHDPDRDSPAEDTHAWAEAHVQGLGWVGFDVTNQICPTDLYVRLCCGLDAADAAPVRGTIRGTTDEALEVEIAVRGQTRSQQQQF